MCFLMFLTSDTYIRFRSWPIQTVQLLTDLSLAKVAANERQLPYPVRVKGSCFTNVRTWAPRGLGSPSTAGPPRVQLPW